MNSTGHCLSFGGMRSTSPLPSLPGPLWLWVVAPDKAVSMGQIEINFLPMLNWIVWNRTVLTSNLCTYTKLNCLEIELLICIQIDLALITYNDWCAVKPNQTKPKQIDGPCLTLTRKLDYIRVNKKKTCLKKLMLTGRLTWNNIYVSW